MATKIYAISAACPRVYGCNKFSAQNPCAGRNVEKSDKKNSFAQFENNQAMLNKLFLSNLNKNKISFKGYGGDPNPAKKLFWLLTNRDAVYEDEWTKQHLYQAGWRKWVNASPSELVKRTPEQAIQSICTLAKPDHHYPYIKNDIPSPNYGDKWGRHANYIEINPRIVAKYDYGYPTEGLFGVIKLLPAIPPSPGSFANCLVLSQLYPTKGDNKDGLYTTDLHRPDTISDVLLSSGLKHKMGADEQVKAFNDLAHMMGFKTGFRMPMLSGSLNLHNEGFDWNNPGHRKAYVDACVWGLELGFDAIYFDSGKHTVDKNCMTPNLGNPPEPWQTAEMFYHIRNNSHKPDAAFIGEKCYDNPQYKDIGFTAGTDWGRADDFESVRWESRKQSGWDSYAAGPEVSNDNDRGELFFEQRLNRLNSCLFGYDSIDKKLPTYMQLHDIFPLSPFTNTKDQMDNAHQMSGSDAWTECERHWDGIFNTSGAAEEYRNNVYHIFENAIRTYG